MSSILARRPMPLQQIYAASKVSSMYTSVTLYLQVQAVKRTYFSGAVLWPAEGKGASFQSVESQ